MASPHSNPLFSLKNFQLEIERGESSLRNISLDLFPGDLLLVEGSNGVGKSSLLRELLHRSRKKPKSIQWSIKNYGYLPQNFENFFHIPIHLQEIIHLFSSSEEIVSPLDIYNLGARWNNASGGEKQKTLLNCILRRSHQLLLLDEPTNHLDEESKKVLAKKLIAYRNKTHAALIIISHDLQNYLADYSLKKLNLDHYRVNHA